MKVKNTFTAVIFAVLMLAANTNDAAKYGYVLH